MTWPSRSGRFRIASARTRFWSLNSASSYGFPRRAQAEFGGEKAHFRVQGLPVARGTPVGLRQREQPRQTTGRKVEILGQFLFGGRPALLASVVYALAEALHLPAEVCGEPIMAAQLVEHRATDARDGVAVERHFPAASPVPSR